jgi:hypothetical protein
MSLSLPGVPAILATLCAEPCDTRENETSASSPHARKTFAKSLENSL